MILPAGLARGYAANEKLNHRRDRPGRHGRDRRANARTSSGENIAALCDVDSAMLDKRGAEYPKAAKYTDFRKMIEKEKLDGVVVATPDHIHAYISVWAMKHGLHVYCQKPLCQTVHEARVMARVAAETKVDHADGNAEQRRAEQHADGRADPVGRCWARSPRSTWRRTAPSGRRDTIVRRARIRCRRTLDWDLWLGPAPVRPYQAM